jgi:hypothetical protein
MTYNGGELFRLRSIKRFNVRYVLFDKVWSHKIISLERVWIPMVSYEPLLHCLKLP